MLSIDNDPASSTLAVTTTYSLELDSSSGAMVKHGGFLYIVTRLGYEWISVIKLNESTGEQAWNTSFYIDNFFLRRIAASDHGVAFTAVTHDTYRDFMVGFVYANSTFGWTRITAGDAEFMDSMAVHFHGDSIFTGAVMVDYIVDHYESDTVYAQWALDGTQLANATMFDHIIDGGMTLDMWFDDDSFYAFVGRGGSSNPTYGNLSKTYYNFTREWQKSSDRKSVV